MASSFQEGWGCAQILLLLLMMALLLVVYVLLATRGYFGVRQTGGEITPVEREASITESKKRSQLQVSKPPGQAGEKQILFGDLHVHTTFSFDAFSISLPMYQGEGLQNAVGPDPEGGGIIVLSELLPVSSHRLF